MNNKIKYLIGAVLIISAVLIVSAQNPNEYYAITSGFSNIQATEAGNEVEISMLVNYVPVTGSATYTLTKVPITTRINVSQPNQINQKIAAAIKAQGTGMGYDVKRVLLPSYNVVNP